MSEKRPIEAKDLFHLRLVTDPQISPSGELVAFAIQTIDEDKNDYVSNIYVADREGQVRQFTSGDKDSTPRWSPDGRYLAFLSGRKDTSQIHLLPTAGGESFALTDRKLGAGAPVWSPDGKWIVFAGLVSTEPEEEENPKEKDDKKPAPTKIVQRASYKVDGVGYIGNRRRHLFLADVDERTVEQITDGDYMENAPAWSPDGQHLAFASKRAERWDVSNESDIYLVPREGGEPRRITSSGAYSRPIFSPDGSRIAFVGNEDPGQMFAPPRLYSVNRAGEDQRDELGDWDGGLGNEVISDVVHSAEEHGVPMAWRPEGIFFIGTVRGEANILCADGKVHPVTEGRHTVTDFSCSDDGTLAFACADATHLPEIYVRTDGESTRLTHENDDFLAGLEIIQPERLSFSGANGEESEGWLLPPRGHESGKHPLIAYIHGGPPLAHGEAFFFEYQFLANQGYGVFYPNIHGSSSYGGEYQTSITADWGNIDYQDVLAGVEAAAERPWVDRERLGIAGGSYGGYMTSWVISHDHRFRAAVVERVLSNFVSFFGTSDFGWAWNRICGVFPEEDVQKLWDMSPIKYVANVETPTLVIHSERDDRTPLEQGEQLFVALRRLGKDTKFIVFPEESHGLSRGGKPSRRVERMERIVGWFREKL